VRQTEVNLIRGQVVKGLVKPIPIIKVKPVTKAGAESSPVVKTMKVDVVVL
jgi:hypothetical protein